MLNYLNSHHIEASAAGRIIDLMIFPEQPGSGRNPVEF